MPSLHPDQYREKLALAGLTPADPLFDSLVTVHEAAYELTTLIERGSPMITPGAEKELVFRLSDAVTRLWRKGEASRRLERRLALLAVFLGGLVVGMLMKGVMG